MKTERQLIAILAVAPLAAGAASHGAVQPTKSGLKCRA